SCRWRHSVGCTRHLDRRRHNSRGMDARASSGSSGRLESCTARHDRTVAVDGIAAGAALPSLSEAIQVCFSPKRRSPQISGKRPAWLICVSAHSMNVLAYVHLRNIHGSTGAGRVARQLMEHVSQRDGVNMHILADEADHRTIVHKVGLPWTTYRYHLFAKDSSYQQAQWLAFHAPVAEKYWPETQVVHCTGESYVPTSKSRLVVTVHDAAYFEPGAHQANFATTKQRLKWRFLYFTLSRTA